MMHQHNAGAALAAPKLATLLPRCFNSEQPQAFDPAAWFAMWSDHGGVAMMIEDRLWVGRTQPLEQESVQTLNAIGVRLHAPGAAMALAGLLRASSPILDRGEG
jgi:hypothetical protein